MEQRNDGEPPLAPKSLAQTRWPKILSSSMPAGAKGLASISLLSSKTMWCLVLGGFSGWWFVVYQSAASPYGSVGASLDQGLMIS